MNTNLINYCLILIYYVTFKRCYNPLCLTINSNRFFFTITCYTLYHLYLYLDGDFLYRLLFINLRINLIYMYLYHHCICLFYEFNIYLIYYVFSALYIYNIYLKSISLALLPKSNFNIVNNHISLTTQIDLNTLIYCKGYALYSKHFLFIFACFIDFYLSFGLAHARMIYLHIVCPVTATHFLNKKILSQIIYIPIPNG